MMLLRIAKLNLYLLLLLLAPLAVQASGKGEQAPEFSLPALDATDTRLGVRDLQGKVVYLDFWASWCAPCRQSLPLLDQMRNAYQREDFEVLAVNLDTDPARGRRFLRHYPVDYPVASDPHGKVAALYQLPNMPTAYIIDRKGNIRQVHNGFRPSDMDGIRRTVDQLITEGGRE